MKSFLGNLKASLTRSDSARDTQASASNKQAADHGQGKYKADQADPVDSSSISGEGTLLVALAVLSGLIKADETQAGPVESAVTPPSTTARSNGSTPPASAVRATRQQNAIQPQSDNDALRPAPDNLPKFTERLIAGTTDAAETAIKSPEVAVPDIDEATAPQTLTVTPKEAVAQGNETKENIRSSDTPTENDPTIASELPTEQSAPIAPTETPQDNPEPQNTTPRQASVASGGAVAENAADGTVVAALTATDADALLLVAVVGIHLVVGLISYPKITRASQDLAGLRPECLRLQKETISQRDQIVQRDLGRVWAARIAPSMQELCRARGSLEQVWRTLNSLITVMSPLAIGGVIVVGATRVVADKMSGGFPDCLHGCLNPAARSCTTSTCSCRSRT
ncbi:hypothetical protein DFP92_10558 [Yoonia sediminilitoris]|uniref:Uncharacterized protein n=1 Tax=Yoonia sediminilitoris TaxID=1286148 RepID=A0A2T6KH70_9RHOB|nr:hypothetical protein C8N45_10558 [Yoonia sediminilitoris]RCW95554.1 hypothetical protein DFP92_10558 [Yoonia sediminilitoris]